MKKRMSVKAQDRLYNHLTREIARDAATARAKIAQDIILLLVHELRAIHTKKYPECESGCPACEAIDAGMTMLKGDLVNHEALAPSIQLALANLGAHVNTLPPLLPGRRNRAEVHRQAASNVDRNRRKDR